MDEAMPSNFPRFEWQPTGTAELQTVGLIILGFLLIVIARNRWEAHKVFLRSRTGLLQIARKRSERCGLSEEESRLWQRMVVENGGPPTLVEFERLVVKLLRTHARPGLIRAVRVKLNYVEPPPGHALHSTREISVGSDLTLALGLNTWRCIVKSVDETRIEIRVPPSAPLYLHNGDPIEIILDRPGDARYRFPSRTIHVRSRPASLLSLEHAEQWERTPQRAEQEALLPIDLIDPSTQGRRRIRPVEVSPTGFRTGPSVLYKIGERYTVVLASDSGGPPLTMSAQVAKAGPGGARFEFTGLTLDQHFTLRRILARLRRRRAVTA